MIVVLGQVPVVDVQLSSTADSITVTWSAPEKGGEPKRYIVRLKKVDSDEKSKVQSEGEQDLPHLP